MNNDFLMKNEKIVSSVKFSVMAFIGMAFKAIILLALACFFLLYDVEGKLGFSSTAAIIAKVAGGIALIWALYTVIKIIVIISTNRLVVTDKRLYGRVGVLAKETLDIPLTKLDNVAVKRDAWGAIFGYNSIVVASTVSNFTFNYAANAEKFKSAIFDAQEIAKETERKEKAKSMADAIAMARNAENYEK